MYMYTLVSMQELYVSVQREVRTARGLNLNFSVVTRVRVAPQHYLQCSHVYVLCNHNQLQLGYMYMYGLRV
jgi:hypothetical protein